MTNSDKAYNDQDFAAIISAFQPNPTFDSEKFRKSLEIIAWLFFEGRTLREKVTKPAGRVNKFRSLSNKVSGLLKALTIVRDDPYTSRFLTDAISAFHSGQSASRVETLEELADKALAEALAERRLDTLVEYLNWSKQVFDIAERGARAAGMPKGGKRVKGGKRPDAELYELILSLREIYEKAAAHPRELSGRDVDSEIENERHEFLKFLRAAIRPLGIKKSDAALRELYRRAITAAGGL